MQRNVFPGRIIFDHLLKTGGTSVGGWLRETLGSGCVTPHVWGEHRDLIKSYGGLYSVISGHFQFYNDEDLDPRYQYLTCLREPVDRAISWIFFSLNDAPVHPNYDSSQLKNAIRQFLETDGSECAPILLRTINNVYVDHFCRIGRNGEVGDEQKLANALAAIHEYDVVGLYEDFSRFTDRVANLIGIAAPPAIQKLNVTSKRPRVDQISPALRERIIGWNQLDLRFYAEVVKWVTGNSPVPVAEPAATEATRWRKFERRKLAVSDPKGALFVDAPVASMAAGSTSKISVRIVNNSAERWVGDATHPINASYHWLNAAGEMKVFDGYRTRMPEQGLPPEATQALNVNVLAPSERGRYILVLTLVQEGVCWFERKGFEPGRLELDVV